MWQQSQGDVRNHDRNDRPPGVIQRSAGIKRLDQVFVLRTQVVDHARETALDVVADQHEHDHDNGNDQHHETLDGVGNDVRVGTAHDDVKQQDCCGDRQCPFRRQAEHHFEHHQSRHQLTGEIEEENQGKDRNHDPNAIGLVAITQVFRYRAVAEAITSGRNEPHADQHAGVDTNWIEEVAPLAREPPLVPEPRTTKERCPAGRRRRKGKRQRHWSICPPGDGEIVRVINSPRTVIPDRQHCARIEHHKNPRPTDQRHASHSPMPVYLLGASRKLRNTGVPASSF